jgi:hypothetical protein|tara:strand:+ start:976 stop:1824 length:849 start_codon:yes stop_codon:yes gene_type:complete
MAFSIKSSASNFMSSIVSDVKDTLQNAAMDAVTQQLGSLGPLGKLAANFINQTGGFGSNGRTVSRALISSNITNTEFGDWRVSISVPSLFHVGNVIKPLLDNGIGATSATATGNRMIFPFNPTVLLSHSANYAAVQPTHTNYVYNAYESSQVDAITLTGEFFQENQNDARYWIACLHFLRSATKMFYGNSKPLGAPPVVCRLNGYGKHVLNDIPVVITNFTTDLPVDVDYIECSVDGHPNYVPTQSSITVTLQPQYARRSQAGFSLNKFASGNMIGGQEGFV